MHTRCTEIGSGVHRKKGVGKEKQEISWFHISTFLFISYIKRNIMQSTLKISGIAHRKLALGIFTPTLCRLGGVFFKANRFRCRPFGSSFAYLKQELSP